MSSLKARGSKEYTYRITEAELVCAVSISLEHKLILSLALDIVHLLSIRIKDGDIDVQMRASARDDKRAINVRSLMDILEKAFLLPWWQVKVDGV